MPYMAYSPKKMGVSQASRPHEEAKLLSRTDQTLLLRAYPKENSEIEVVEDDLESSQTDRPSSSGKFQTGSISSSRVVQVLRGKAVRTCYLRRPCFCHSG
jgi:hypothetical protein